MPDEMNNQTQQEAATPAQQVPIQQPDVAAQSVPVAQAQAPVQQQVARSTSGMGIASLVLGILAILTSFLPIINNGSFFLAILGLIFAVVGIIATGKGKKGGRGIVIAGLVLNILSIVIVLATQSMYGAAIDSALESTEKATASNTATNAAPATNSQQAANTNQQAQEAQQQQEQANNQQDTETQEAADEPAEQTNQAAYTVNIEGVRLGQDYEGNEVAIVTYSWENNSDEADSFWLVFHPKVFQNNVETEVGISSETDNDGYMAEVKPGGGTSFEIAYEIKDHSDITVEISPLFDWNNEIIAEQTFSLE
ncbi:MAG: DUF5067 domain-containing protein [Eggerthellaceae bacterium]|nr:DUF5067 domain-containing protein [Eggerthellaceae bacterium]